MSSFTTLDAWKGICGFKCICLIVYQFKYKHSLWLQLTPRDGTIFYFIIMRANKDTQCVLHIIMWQENLLFNHPDKLHTVRNLDCGVHSPKFSHTNVAKICVTTRLYLVWVITNWVASKNLNPVGFQPPSTMDCRLRSLTFLAVLVSFIFVWQSHFSGSSRESHFYMAVLVSHTFLAVLRVAFLYVSYFLE